MYNLVIAEKQSVAKSLAAVLNADKRQEGFFIGNGYVVSWCAGHLLELAAPNVYDEKYTKWHYADLPIIPDIWKHVASKGKAAQLKILKDLMKRSDVDTITNACDAGREGELIFRHVYEHAKCTKPIMRLWISSMEDAAIRAGFDRLKNGVEYDNLFTAASCRERADWLVGLNSTRAFSTLYGSTLGIGRVQSPTLAMLVKREQDIESFVKETFFVPVLDIGFTASGDRFTDRQTADNVSADCDGKTAVLRSVERLNKTVSPPKLYDLTSLQRESNRLLGFTAQQTLDYAQSLYEKKILSYPRTDSRFLTGDMRETADAMVKWLQLNMPYTEDKTFTPDIERLIDDKRVTDHHALIPTAEIVKCDLAALPVGEREILNLVAVRMLCACATIHSYEAVKAIFECGGHIFTSKGKTVISDGWQAIDKAFKATLKAQLDSDENEDDSSDEDDYGFPEMSVGLIFPEVTVKIKEGFTSPQKHFTEDTLLSSMETAGAEDMPEDAERRGLGTPATRAAIIEKLVKSGLVERKKKNLLPTEKGKNLIAVLPVVLTSAKLTAEWENKLKQVERGELRGGEFMESITKFTESIIVDNKVPKAEFVGLFGEKQAAGNAPIGVCPRCGSPVRENGKGFFCNSRECGFRIWKTSKFWLAKKKTPTSKIIAALLKEGRVFVSGLYSEKTGKTYDATVILDDTGEQFVNFKLEFARRS